MHGTKNLFRFWDCCFLFCVGRILCLERRSICFWLISEHVYSRHTLQPYSFCSSFESVNSQNCYCLVMPCTHYISIFITCCWLRRSVLRPSPGIIILPRQNVSVDTSSLCQYIYVDRHYWVRFQNVFSTRADETYLVGARASTFARSRNVFVRTSSGPIAWHVI